jgi:1,2-phenylacetyl-CoA epoxidase PaaB subunit
MSGQPAAPNPRWHVLGKRTATSPWQVVGDVHAPDAELALLLAKESFFRHREGVRLGVTPRDAAHPAEPGAGLEVRHELEPADLMEPATDKSYRLQTGYAGLGRKRRAAAERVRSAGLRIDRPRPANLREDSAAARAPGVERG